MNFGSNPKVGLRWCGVPIALASAGAISLVALCSFGAYGAAMILGRVGPLRKAYQFLSRAYDRLLDQLGKKILHDSRDTPALRFIERMADSMTQQSPRATIGRVAWISCGISRTTFGRFWGLPHTPTLRMEAMRRTEDACYGVWRATMPTSEPSLSTTGELGSCSCWFLFSA